MESCKSYAKTACAAPKAAGTAPKLRGAAAKASPAAVGRFCSKSFSMIFSEDRLICFSVQVYLRVPEGRDTARYSVQFPRPFGAGKGSGRCSRWWSRTEYQYQDHLLLPDGGPAAFPVFPFFASYKSPPCPIVCQAGGGIILPSVLKQEAVLFFRVSQSRRRHYSSGCPKAGNGIPPRFGPKGRAAVPAFFIEKAGWRTRLPQGGAGTRRRWPDWWREGGRPRSR